MYIGKGFRVLIKWIGHEKHFFAKFGIFEVGVTFSHIFYKEYLEFMDFF